jgi:hypothetical protein
MIVLRATRLDAVSDRFQFRIEVPGCVPVTTASPEKAAKVLSVLGVTNPLHLVDHVTMWGEVEIVEPELPANSIEGVLGANSRSED